MTAFGWIDPTQPPYNMVPNSSSDQTSIWNNIMSDIAGTGGRVQFPPGTYNLQNAYTHTPGDQEPLVVPTESIHVHGAGIGLTTLTTITTGPNPNSVTTLSGNGGFYDLTVDGAGYSVTSLTGENPAVSGSVISQIFERVKARNNWDDSPSPGGQVFATNAYPQDKSPTTILLLYMHKVTIEGPTDPGQDMIGIANVDTAMVKDLTIRNGCRSPNFYFGNRVLGHGLALSNISDPTNVGCLIFDEAMNYIQVDGLAITSVDESTAFVVVKALVGTQLSNAVIQADINLGFNAEILEKTFAAHSVELGAYIMSRINGASLDPPQPNVPLFNDIQVIGGRINVPFESYWDRPRHAASDFCGGLVVS